MPWQQLQPQPQLKRGSNYHRRSWEGMLPLIHAWLVANENEYVHLGDWWQWSWSHQSYWNEPMSLMAGDYDSCWLWRESWEAKEFFSSSLL